MIFDCAVVVAVTAAVAVAAVAGLPIVAGASQSNSDTAINQRHRFVYFSHGFSASACDSIHRICVCFCSCIYSSVCSFISVCM